MALQTIKQLSFATLWYYTLLNPSILYTKDTSIYLYQQIMINFAIWLIYGDPHIFLKLSLDFAAIFLNFLKPTFFFSLGCYYESARVVTSQLNCHIIMLL